MDDLAADTPYRSLFENMLHGFAYCRMIFDAGVPADFVYLEVNEAFGRLTGLRGVVGRRVSEVIPGIRESDPGLFEIYGRVAATGNPERFEMFVEALGEWFLVSVYRPAPGHFVALFDVITDRKRTEFAREATLGLLALCNRASDRRELMRGLVEHFRTVSGCEAVGIRMREGDDYPYYESRGFPDDFIRVENRLCEAGPDGAPVVGKDGDPILSCMCGNVLRGRFDPGKPFFTPRGSFWTNGTTALLAGTSEADRLARTRNRCNGEGYESVALVPIRHRGRTFGLVQFNDKRPDRFPQGRIALLEELVDSVAVAVAKLDADETLRLLETQLRQSQKMEAIGLLAGGVAHDFNNLLTVIYGYGNVLRGQVPSGSPMQADLDQVIAAAERGARLTRSLLAFSRKQLMAPRPIDLNAVVREAGRFLDRVIGEDVRIEASLSPGEIRLSADPAQVEQLLVNLATNARDAMPAGGTFRIRTGTRPANAAPPAPGVPESPGGWAVLEVSDNGVGMDEATRRNIFDPFFTTKAVGKGTGLGLSIVYGIVKQHGGLIEVESAPGRGATFRILLPLGTGGASEAAGPAGDEAPATGTETILLAEDDDTIRRLFETTLKEFGYRVVTARDGREAVEVFRTGEVRIDLFVSDLVMPGQGGIAAHAEIDRLRPGQRTLFMTGYSPDLLADRGTVADVHDVILKPVAPLDFVRKVREVLDRPPRGGEPPA